jgi:hypothetical protein
MHFTKTCGRLGLTVLVAGALAAPAAAQMMERPYDFGPRDRAGIAALMQQVENQRAPGPSSVSNTQIKSTTVLCGEGGTGGTGSTSKANANCIVLDDATGQVNVGQNSAGNQDANANSSTTENSISGALEGLE